MGARNHRFIHLGALVGVLFVAGVAAVVMGGSDEDPPRGQLLPAAPSTTALPTGLAAAATPTSVPLPLSADFSAARALHREGRFGEARAAFQAVSTGAVAPAERAAALLGAGDAAFALNDSRAGFEALGEAVKVAPVGSDVAVRAHYSLLRRLNDDGRFEEAAALFNAKPSLAGGSPLEPYYRFEGGRAQWWTAGNAIWLGLLSDPSVSAALKTAIRRELVARWREHGDVKGLKLALDELIADTADSEARFERAGLALVEGDLETAARLLRAIVTDDPASRFASLALDELAAVSISIDPGVAGLAYYRRGSYQRAIDVLTPAVDSAANANETAFRSYYLAAAHEDLGNGPNAVRYYDRAAGSGANSPYVHRAKYWAARVTEWSGTATEASRRYVSLAQDGPAGEFTQESAFRAGYVLFQADDSSGALAVWESLSNATSPRLEYWRGRALSAAGNQAGARAAYQRAAALGPLDLYGLEAARELGTGQELDVSFRERNLDRKIDWAAISSWLSGRIGGAPPGSQPTAACELMAASLRPAAAAEIWAADARGGTWRSFELMREASECGLADVAAQLAVSIRTEAGAASHEPPKDLLRVSYPLDYVGTLVNEARKANVDPLFFAALVRQESFWDPSAASLAGAFGLTQVILPTGEAIASELGVAEFRVSMLLQPSLSLEFGAYYLGGQVRRYGDPLVALSAYNAGPGNASRWAMAGESAPADLVEVIDFSETKAYVTYIFEAYAHYKLAWGE